MKMPILVLVNNGGWEMHRSYWFSFFIAVLMGVAMYDLYHALRNISEALVTILMKLASGI